MERIDAIQHALATIISSDDAKKGKTAGLGISTPDPERLDELGRPTRARQWEDATAQKAVAAAAKARTTSQQERSQPPTPAIGAKAAPPADVLAKVSVELLDAKLQQLEDFQAQKEELLI